ncbi:MAG: hypothetical protein ACO25B_13795, partial [Chitinophagaceae bacterium]
MQPKFTLRNLWSISAKMTILMVFLAFTVQSGLAQVAPVKDVKKESQALRNAKLAFIQAQKNPNIFADNDAGLPNRKVIARNNPAAVCQTFTGALAPGGPTMPNRLNRNGVQGVCPGPKPFAAPFTGTILYNTHTWTNASGLSQCATFTLSTTDATTNIEFGVWNGSFNPASIGTNF